MIPLDDARIRTAEAVFQALADRPAEQREAALSAHCGSDLALRSFVAELLQRDSRAAPDLLERVRLRPPPDAPHTVGRYRILGRIGEGGMGVVYEAVQESPQRHVAVKLIRNGLISGEALRRFRREGELLGQLEHPGIARIYEAGTADVAAPGWRQPEQPFLALELVHGEPLVASAARRGLAIPARLELVAQVCDIVQYAHQKGVIHRDLKPANILLDTDGQPRILDFGVGRAAHPGPDTFTAHTEAGQLLGTLAYMSPEQLSGDPRAVDTRSDIYALGVIAYELLCGRTPLELAGRPLPEAIRILAENEPPRPGSLRPELRGDIDAILSRALEKRPERRYSSAAEFAADIRRHLRHEAVLARPPSALYQFRKFARRNRALVAVAGLAFAALVAGLAGVAIFAWRERAQAEQTRSAAARAEAVTRFLREMLAAADPRAVRGRDVSVRQVLDAAAQRIDSGELADEPEVEAALRSTIGETYLGLGAYAEARRHLEAALTLCLERYGPPHDDTIANLNLLARALDGLADFTAAEQRHREALAAARALRGDTLQTARILTDLGLSLLRRGALEDAEALQREALALRETLPDATPLDLAESFERLGWALHERGRPAEAEPPLRRALELRRAHQPPDHPDLARTLSQFGYVLYRAQAWDEAEPLLREALDIYRRTHDPLHPDLARCLNFLAMVVKRRQNAEAIPLMREALDIQVHRLGPQHPEVAEALLNLGHVLSAVGQHDEADRVARRALQIQRTAFGPRHQEYAFALHNVAALQLLRGDPQGAEPLFREALDILVERLGPEHELTVHMRDSLGVTLSRLERDEEAIAHLEAVLARRRALRGDSHAHVAITRANLVFPRLRTGDAAGALDDAVAAIPPLREVGGMPSHLANALLAQYEARLALHQPFDLAEAEAAIDEAVALRRGEFGEHSWPVADAERIRALCLARSGRPAEAEAALHCAAELLDALAASPDPGAAAARRRVHTASAALFEFRASAEPGPDPAAANAARQAEPPAPPP